MRTRTSVNHFTGREQELLAGLKGKIVSLYKPLLIYHIGSNMSTCLQRSCFSNPYNGEQRVFACDLLVVLPDNGAAIPQQAAQDLQSLNPEYGAIRLMVHPLGFVKEQLAAFSLFFCWVQRHAILLYEKDNAGRLLPEPVSNIRPYQQQAEQFFTANPHYDNYTDVRLSPLPQRTVKKEPFIELHVPVVCSPELQKKMAALLREFLSG